VKSADGAPGPMLRAQVVNEESVVFGEPLERRIEKLFQIRLLVERLEIGNQKVLGRIRAVELVVALFGRGHVARPRRIVRRSGARAQARRGEITG
jgi:hypothetical protein